MKNLDRIYGLSKSQILLEELTSTMNLDYYIRSQSNQLLSMYKEKNPNWTETDSDYIVRIAIFITSKLKHTGVDTTSLRKDKIRYPKHYLQLRFFHYFIQQIRRTLVEYRITPERGNYFS